MTTNLLDRVPLERIRTEAHQFRLGVTLLTLLIGIFWALGWLVGKATLAVGFAWAAAKVGFQDARGVQAGPRGQAP